MSKRRVVVTGLGLVTPVGNTVAETWRNIVAGVSGVSEITHFDTTGFPVRIGGSIRGLDLERYISKKDQRKMDPFIHYGMAAGIQAVEDSGLSAATVDPHRVGVAIGSGIGGLPGIEKGTQTLLEGGPRRISPFYVPSNIINMIAGHHDVGIAVFDDTGSVTDIMGAGGTGGDDGEIRTLEAVAYGQVPGDHIDDIAGHIKGGNAPWSAFHEGLRGFFNAWEAAYAGADGNTDAVRIRIGGSDARILHGLYARRHAVMYERVHLALIFFRDVLLQIQVADGTAYAYGKSRGVEMGDLPDAADAGNDIAPCIHHRISDRCDQAQACDNNTALAHNVFPL